MPETTWTPANTLPPICDGCRDRSTNLLLTVQDPYAGASQHAVIGWYDHERQQWRNQWGHIKNVTHWLNIEFPQEGS